MTSLIGHNHLSLLVGQTGLIGGTMRIAKIVGLAAMLSPAAFAGSITITHSTLGTGSIGAISFTNAPFTITELGDTANRQVGGGQVSINDNSASITIIGIGTFGFTTPTRSIVTSITGNEGIFPMTSAFIAALTEAPINTAFVTWDMTTSLGPFTGQGLIRPVTVQTTGGALMFNFAQPSVTFQAVVGAGPVPEPASVALFALGLAGLGLAGYRRRQPGLKRSKPMDLEQGEETKR